MEGAYIIRPILAMLPAWFRLAQCLRRYRDTKDAFLHLTNAAKYAMSFFVVIFSSMSFVTGICHLFFIETMSTVILRTIFTQAHT